jgi:hypothetical protein
MEAYYPISALAHGQALNITVLSYAGSLYFGFTGCPDRVPHLQRLAVYTGDALDELEQVYLHAGSTPSAVPASPKSARPVGKRARRKAATPSAGDKPRRKAKVPPAPPAPRRRKAAGRTAAAERGETPVPAKKRARRSSSRVRAETAGKVAAPEAPL